MMTMVVVVVVVVQSCPWVGLTYGLGWVGLGHTKWTHGQLCGGAVRFARNARNQPGTLRSDVIGTGSMASEPAETSSECGTAGS